MLTVMTLLTALRTAATSAMAARHLAPANSKVMGMIGNGAQAEFQALAMKAVIGIEEVRLRSEEHTSELQSLMRISYAVFCLKKKKLPKKITSESTILTTSSYSNTHKTDK